ncbi:hypothetical protein M427DRAFT_165646 [Gonapodya prolifera JEL478]|uniref:Helicase C-terminal domain-containing protein n=1 Tax=Gonapodya prolifera (strain JEL478) TaxID=1344416 RepID=A0A139AZH1_GONPJ|nr:hypothetical protein M427DRAFT_165646 [Gonapodya prolifera JEL478]|eukprot:KXS22131.1 hypothetical protein M427DRAFT_165646 [Gonapodya prolifera JEL478]
MWEVSKGNDLLHRMQPDAYFPSKHRVSRKEVRQYERDLKVIFLSWLRDPQTERWCYDVVKTLRIDETFRICDDAAANWEAFRNSVLDLALQLRDEDKLPAIYFCFDRNLCNAMAQNLNKELEDRQEKKRAQNASLVKKAQARKEQLDRQAKAKRDLAAKQTQPQTRKAAANAEQQDVLEPALAALLADVDPEFSFRGRNHGVSDEDFQEITKAARRIYPSNSPLMVALKRGIGVHHAGCNKKYTEVVEVLLRRRYLTVVFATGTLALGINMPCRSAVFLGDSPYLNALNYRQMRGRAARRGFDDIGHVIFYGIAHSKIRRLMTAELPRLRGHFPLTTTLVLRLMSLFNESKDKARAGTLVTDLLEQPLFSHGVERLELQMRHKFLFSLEYLSLSGLLDAKGLLRGPAGIIAHLHYHEPSNFHFVALLGAGVFAEICERFEEDNKGVEYELLLILSHLFGRRYVPPYVTEEFVKERGAHPSKVILEAMPYQAQRVIADHDERALKVFAKYAKTFAISKGERVPTLPISKIPVGAPLESPTFLPAHIAQTHFVARSPFCALSGFGDVFQDAADLSTNAIEGLYLDPSSLPITQHIVVTPQRDAVLQGLKPQEKRLNRYLLDFMTHGQPKALVSSNFVRAGDVWLLLQDFHLVLKAVCVALEAISTGGTVEDMMDAEDRKLESGSTIDSSDAGASDEESGGASARRPPLAAETKVLRAFQSLRDNFAEQFYKIWA